MATIIGIGGSLTVTGQPFTATEGMPFSGSVASYTQSLILVPLATSGSPQATIAWGDGTTTAGTITFGSGPGNLVTGSHTYTEEGQYTVQVTVSSGTGASNSASYNVTVADAPLTPAGLVLAPVQGATFTGELTRFQPPAAVIPDDYAIDVNWGDGGASPGSIQANPDGSYSVVGTHPFVGQGNQPVTVSVTDLVAHATALLSDPAPPAAGLSPLATVNTPFTGAVATFRDANPLAQPGDFNANINWGDGNSSPGTIQGNPDGSWSVVGTHTYQSTGPFTVATSISDVGGSSYQPTIVLTVYTPTQRFVAAAYEDVLGRPPEDTGLANWDFALNHGLSALDLARQLAHSPEYYRNLVTTAYHHYLGRAPDQTGLDGWVAAMQQGLTDERLEAGFIGSPEYIANQGGSGPAWIQGMYQDLLGRTPSQAEVDGWVSALQTSLSPTQVAYGFAASPEREGQHVTADYGHYLHRTPAQAEVDGWVRAFLVGQTNENVVSGFVGSAEYYKMHTGTDLPPQAPPDQSAAPQPFLSNGVYYYMPAGAKLVSSNGSVYTFAVGSHTLVIDSQKGTIQLDGKSYGPVATGDRVLVSPSGAVFVDGIQRRLGNPPRIVPLDNAVFVDQAGNITTKLPGAMLMNTTTTNPVGTIGTHLPGAMVMDTATTSTVGVRAS
jgi:hypothetical protein